LKVGFTNIYKVGNLLILMPIKDPELRRAYRRKWYSENKTSEREHVYRRKKVIKKWFNDYKRTLKCALCGENHPATLDFHHKNRKTKEFGINARVHSGYSLEVIKKELKKCEVLCANCHRKLHYQNSNL
jgi:transcription elongation factor Elf1